jgi:hypothetical protein
VIGIKSFIAAGAHLPPGTCLAPSLSSYEIQGAQVSNRTFARQLFPSPPLWLRLVVGYPCVLAASSITIGVRLLSWLALISIFDFPDTPRSYGEFLGWFASFERCLFYMLVRCVRATICPVLYLLVVIVLKRVVIGKFEKGPWNTWKSFQYWLMSSLLPGGDLGGAIAIVGSHYEIVSMIYRALGAKVGKRVYWPGSGLEIVGEFSREDPRVSSFP